MLLLLLLLVRGAGSCPMFDDFLASIADDEDGLRCQHRPNSAFVVL
jgi:hypothetical protein